MRIRAPSRHRTTRSRGIRPNRDTPSSVSHASTHNSRARHGSQATSIIATARVLLQYSSKGKKTYSAVPVRGGDPYRQAVTLLALIGVAIIAAQSQTKDPEWRTWLESVGDRDGGDLFPEIQEIRGTFAGPIARDDQFPMFGLPYSTFMELTPPALIDIEVSTTPSVGVRWFHGFGAEPVRVTLTLIDAIVQRHDGDAPFLATVERLMIGLVGALNAGKVGLSNAAPFVEV
jgi:hypothetical protein